MPQHEPLMTLAQAAAWMETELGQRRTARRLWEWVTRGRRGVKLAAVWNGCWMTRPSAIRAFLADSTRQYAHEMGIKVEVLRV